MKSISAVILSAGFGKRMKSKLPKVVHSVCGQPMINYPLFNCEKLKIGEAILVVPQNHQKIKDAIHPKLKINPSFAIQNPPKGTGDAVKCGIKKLSKSSKHTLVLCGDMPLISQTTIKKLITKHQKSKSSISFLSTIFNHQHSYGRIIRKNHQVVKIVEDKDATINEKKVKEVNLGVYCFNNHFLKKYIKKLTNKNAQKEYYITDLIEIALKENLKVEAICIKNSIEGLGINTQDQLRIAEEEFFQRKRNELIQKGVKLVGKDQIFIEPLVEIKKNTTIYSPNHIFGLSKIGSDNIIEPGCVIKDCLVGNNNLIKAHCYLNQSEIKSQVDIGPFAHLRPKTVLGSRTKVGNFVEIKKSTLDHGSKASHLSYIGDATIGKNVNIGAGMITCNYDGINKFKTIIEDNVFIGSDTQLVAPVRIEKNSYIGAGSTITKNVKSKSLALSRSPQKNIENWKTKK
jgi:bifunctional UDP-N-acetylglucosamine pyrophosphorylase/glucosamine-1-phosphate N-acetyltransferase